MRNGLLSFLLLTSIHLLAQPGSISSTQKISAIDGNLTAQLDVSDYFGYSVANIGDLNKDGITDVAVGSILFEDSSQGSYSTIGAVYVLFLDTDGKVKSHQIISENMGGFTAILHNTNRFGTSVEGLGDMDGDSIPDLAVGQVGLYGEGYVWILFLKADGSVKSYQQIGYGNLGGFSGNINDKCFFAHSIANIGDINGDGVIDLAVGQYGDDDGYTDAGAIWILKMNTNGTVKSNQKISALSGNFNGTITNFSYLGYAVEALPDVNNDGIAELLVGEVLGGMSALSNGGELWLMSIDSSGLITSAKDIYGYKNQLGTEITKGDWFGCGIASIGDINKDGINDIAVGAYASDEIPSSSGSVLILFLDSNQNVSSVQEISGTEGNLTGLAAGDYFGYSVSALGDLNGDGTPDMLVGAHGDDAGGSSIGAVWNCFLSDGIVTTISDTKAQEKIIAYPNPTTGVLYFTNLKSNATVDVYSITGTLVLSDIQVSAHSNVYLTNQPDGIYIVKIKTEEGIFCQKTQVVSH